MKIRYLFVLTLLLPSCLFGLGGVAVEPFYVSKVGPSGSYSTKQFALLWAAFCEQYRIGPKGTFIQYPFAQSAIASAGGYTSFGRLFNQHITDSGGHLVGAHSEYSSRLNPILTEDDAKQYVMQRMTRLVTLRVGNESIDKVPGAYECTVVNAPKPIQLLDQDVRDNPKIESVRPNLAGRSFIYFADPASPKQGVVELRVSFLIEDVEAVCYTEVGKIQDTKVNQDNFIEALKAGSCFRVYVFKQSACYNCGGLGRLAPKAPPGSSRIPGRVPSTPPSSLSLPSTSTNGMSGSNALDDKCSCCGGTGRIPLGKVYGIVWDNFDPTLSNSHANRTSR
jgi:hypothetical protein